MAKKPRVVRTTSSPATRRKRRPKLRGSQKRFSRWPTNAVILLGALAAIAGISAALVLLGDNGVSGPSGLPRADDPGPIHIHGLGVNPSDGSLFIATHTGTYRAEKGERRAERVGNSTQDTMGFTVVGRDHFLGSGHPDVRAAREEGLPPLLGLVESTDGGRTWEPISLLGQADFHVLRSVRGRVFGFDVTNSRLLVSRDGGRTWQDRQEPGSLVDLAVSPANVSELVASTEGSLFRSTDEARTWKLRAQGAGLLAWPVPKRLYLVDGAGQVHVSRNAGRTWTGTGNIGGQPAAFMSDGARALYVALHDGTVKRSADGGATWTVRSVP